MYAVDASDIVTHAKGVISHNHLSEKVEVIQSKVEELELPEKVDLIVSEWMGTLLLVRDYYYIYYTFLHFVDLWYTLQENFSDSTNYRL